ncbi:hypothetical protein LTR10_007486 [Elasticomyces elasticus]|nr:hypothetical protein LTR10_007486 [Elasticomyces elasticus]KAK4979293.1 hypothetical protein LTR42_001796 [Elasticomyces elasticus]
MSKGQSQLGTSPPETSKHSYGRVWHGGATPVKDPGDRREPHLPTESANHATTSRDDTVSPPSADQIRQDRAARAPSITTEPSAKRARQRSTASDLTASLGAHLAVPPNIDTSQYNGSAVATKHTLRPPVKLKLKGPRTAADVRSTIDARAELLVVATPDTSRKPADKLSRNLSSKSEITVKEESQNEERPAKRQRGRPRKDTPQQSPKTDSDLPAASEACIDPPDLSQVEEKGEYADRPRGASFFVEGTSEAWTKLRETFVTPPLPFVSMDPEPETPPRSPVVMHYVDPTYLSTEQPRPAANRQHSWNTGHLLEPNAGLIESPGILIGLPFGGVIEMAHCYINEADLRREAQSSEDGPAA